MRSPSISVWCDPWLVQVASTFFHALIIVHRVHCSEKHGLLVALETSSFWDQSTSDCWMYFTYISDVTDVLGEVLMQQYIVLQCRINEVTSWMSLNCSEMQEVLGRVRVQVTLKPFLRSSSLCQTSYPIVKWPLRSTIELCLEFFHNIVKSYCSIIFSRDWMIMSQQSDHDFWH